MDNDCSSLNLVALHPLMEVATKELRLNQNNFIPVFLGGHETAKNTFID